MFVNKAAGDQDIQNRLSEIQSQLGFQGNQYLFLRSIWKSHSHQYTHAVVDFDDHLDRLNKIVAMMKKHINYNVKKELNYQSSSYSGDPTFRQSRALQSMNRAHLQAEQYRTKLAESIKQNSLLKQANNSLKQQIHQLKVKRKQDTKAIKQLAQKTAELQNRILSSSYQESKSINTYMRSSRGQNLSKSITKQQSLLNISITNNIHLPNLVKQKTERSRYNSKSRLNNSRLRQACDSDDKWLNQTSFIQSNDLNESIISISSYGVFCQPKKQTGLQRISSYQQNKENLQDSKLGFTYESQRNLGKERSLKKRKIQEVSKIDILGESPGRGLKFIRQNSKKALLRKSQKLLQSRLLTQESK